MLEAKYFRDYKHNYMILPCRSGLPEKSYQCRQLTAGKIGELLCCSMRHVNGMTYFYYDISSRTTLESLYRDRQMSYDQIRELLEQLCGMCRRVGDYFMDETKLVFLPEYIFYDLSRKKYIGLYYPDYEGDRPYEALMDYLLEHMDSQDERLADCIYQIYERAEDSGFSLCDALQILEESGQQEEKPERGAAIYDMRSEGAFLRPGSVSTENEKAETADVQADFFDSREDTSVPWEEKEDESAPVKKKSSFSLFLLLVSALGIVGIVYIYVSYELSDREVMTLLGCGALMGVCCLAGLMGALKGGTKKEKKERAQWQETGKKNVEDMADLYMSAKEPVSLDRVLSRGSGIRMESPVHAGTGGDARQEEESCGDTVFFDSAEMAEQKLYALDKKNKKHITLNKFPFTVGKMAGCVDCVLMDDSVSRIHARFEKAGDVIQLTDMNSTNGTYRNGLRMQPQETVEIEPGDEIRFGNLNYCYR